LFEAVLKKHVLSLLQLLYDCVFEGRAVNPADYASTGRVTLASKL